jgi:hypothetical protein
VPVAHLVGLTLVYSTSTLVEGFVLAVVFATFGYLLSERYKRARGVTPWRLPSAVWALVLFMSTLIGAIVYLIACFTTRPVGPTGWAGGGTQSWHPGASEFEHRPPAGWHGGPPGEQGPGAAQGWDAPPPGGWQSPPPPGTVFPGLQPPGSQASVPAPVVPPPPPSPRAWLADPAGRHELRYWDGTKFTEHVADAGKITIDPL